MSKKIMFVLLVGVMPIYAVPVTMLFEGTIESHVNDPAIGDDIPIGTLYSGQLSYDTDEVDWQKNNSTSTTYEFYGSAILSVLVNQYEFVSEDVRIVVRHDPDYTSDEINILSLCFTEYEGINWGIGLSFINSWMNTLDSTALPIEPINLGDWPYAVVGIYDRTTPNGPGNPPPTLMGPLTSITPEPATLALLAIGGVVMVRRR